jgi:hypothetical protein
MILRPPFLTDKERATVVLGRCSRCGSVYRYCLHSGTYKTITDDHAVRIAARYAIGLKFNPDHDTADYFTDPPGEEL